MRVYQRLLAYDQEEATDLVDEALKSQTLPEVYDTLLIPALALAARDQHDGSLDDQREAFIRRAMREIIEDLGDRYQLSSSQTTTAANQAPQSFSSTPGADDAPHPARVICLPARDEADEIVGLMLSQVLEKSGISTRVIPVAALASEMVNAVQRGGSPHVVISALPPSATIHARYLCKRLRGHGRQPQITIGLWSSKQDLKKAAAKLDCGENDKIVNTLTDAAAYLAPIIAAVPSRSKTPTEHPVHA
jgi:hypothetical protein